MILKFEPSQKIKIRSVNPTEHFLEIEDYDTSKDRLFKEDPTKIKDVGRSKKLIRRRRK